MSNVAISALQGSVPQEALRAKAFIEEARQGTLEAPFMVPDGLGNWQEIIDSLAKAYRLAAFSPGGSRENAIAVVERFIGDCMTNEAFKALMEIDAAESDPVVIEDISVPPVPAEALPDPAEIKKGRRALDRFIEWSMRWAPFADYCYHEGAAIWLYSTITARRLVVKGLKKPYYTGWYVFFIGPTSVGKSEVADNAAYVLEQLGLDFLMTTSKMSPELFKRIASQYVPDKWDTLDYTEQEDYCMKLAFAGKTAFHSDEFGQLLRRITNPSHHMFEWLSMFLSWENSQARDGQGSITNGMQKIRNPYFPALCCMTLSNIIKLPSTSDIWENGLLARAMAFIAMPKGYMEINEDDEDEDIQIPADWLQELHSYHERLGIPRCHVEKKENAKDGDKGSEKYRVEWDVPFREREMRLSKEARVIFTRYVNAIGRIGYDRELVPEELHGNYKRYKNKLVGLAAMLSFYDGLTEIDVPHISAAIDVMERVRAHAHQFHAQCFAPPVSVKKGIEKSVENCIEKNSKKGLWMGEPEIGKYCNKAIEEIQKPLELLIKSGRIVRATKIAGNGRVYTKYGIPGIPLPKNYTLS